MPQSISAVLELEVSPSLAGHPYYARALELARRIRHKSKPTDEEILVLAIAGLQAEAAKYVQPNGPTAEETLHAFLRILDHKAVVKAEFLTLHRLLREYPTQPAR